MPKPLKGPSLAHSVPKPLKAPSLARSVPKPLKAPSLARSVPKPLKVPSLARSVPKPLKVLQKGAKGGLFFVPRDSLTLRCRPPTPLVVNEMNDDDEMNDEMSKFWVFDPDETYIYYRSCIYLKRYKRKMCTTIVLWV